MTCYFTLNFMNCCWLCFVNCNFILSFLSLLFHNRNQVQDGLIDILPSSNKAKHFFSLSKVRGKKPRCNTKTRFQYALDRVHGTGLSSPTVSSLTSSRSQRLRPASFPAQLSKARDVREQSLKPDAYGPDIVPLTYVLFLYAGPG